MRKFSMAVAAKPVNGVAIAMCFAFLLLLTGCGGKSEKTVVSTGTSGLNLPPAHTQAWVTQVQDQTLPPASYESLLTQGWGLNTVVSIAGDKQGNAIVSGYTGDEFPGSANLSWNRNAFVAKFNSQGTLMWTQQFSPSSDQSADDVDAAYAAATDAAGNIYAGGITFGAFPGYVNPENRECLFLAKIDPNGKLLWVQQYFAINSRIHYGFGMTLTPSGKIAFGWIEAASETGTGDFTSMVVIDPEQAQIVGTRAYFGVNDLTALTSDSQGNLILTGTSQGSFPGTVSGSWGSFIAKVSLENGTVIWKQFFPQQAAQNNEYIDIESVAVDGNGDVVAGGVSSTSLAFCQGLCYPALPGNMFLAKMDGASGAILWTKQIGNDDGDGITGVAIGSGNDVFAVGYTSDVLAAGFTLPQENLFALKMDASGNIQWAQQFGTGNWGSGADPLYGMPAAVDSSGNLILAAETQHAFAGYSNPGNVSQVFTAKFRP